jgi:hypothetical protein
VGQREKRTRVREDGADKLGPREKRGRAGWCRQAGPACQAQGARRRGRAGGGGGGGLIGPTWAEIGFPFSWDFLIAFLFIFSRVFNSNQVSNSNQIKNMQQFKEYLDSI